MESVSAPSSASRSIPGYLTSRGVATKVCVGVVTEVLLAHLGVVAAVGGLVVSLTVSEAVGQYIRRRKWRARRLWVVALLIWLFDHAEKAFAAVRLPRRKQVSGDGPAVSVASVISAAFVVVAAFTTVEAVAGGSLFAHRRTTFFSGEAPTPVRGPHSPVPTVKDTTPPRISATDSYGTSVPRAPTPAPSVADETPPKLELTAPFVAATSREGAVVTYFASATDLVSGPAEPSCAPASGNVFPIGISTVTCHAADASGNSATESFEVVVDDEPPAFGPSETATARAADPSGARVEYSVPAATDAVDGSIATKCDPAPGSLFPVGSTSVTCVATDSGGHEATTSVIVVVVDRTPPVVAVPSKSPSALAPIP
jgi:hypothetical protein